MLIGLAGYARAGKNTVSAILDEYVVPYPNDFIEESFARRLKISAARALGIEVPDDDAIALMDQLKTDGSIAWSVGYDSDTLSGRQYLQRYGTEAHRDVFGDDFWVEQVVPRGFSAQHYNSVVVITDVRFENEAQAIRREGGVIWAIDRDEAKPAGDHPSEKPLPEHLVDRRIDNNGTLQDLIVEVRQAYKATLPKPYEVIR